MAEWVCSVCGYVYDEKIGDVAHGVPAGTAFADIPANWTCPVCRAGKEAFRPLAAADAPAREGTTVSDIMAAELVAWGVTVVFGLPGTSSLGLVEAIRKNPKIRYIVVRHEANASMAASAYHKLTGKVAACLTIAGPGATNLATGLYDAKEDHASVLSLNGQVETQYAGAGGVQEIDQDAFFRPITVYNNTVYEKKMAVLLLTRALKYAVLDRGVAQLSVPNNIQKQPLDAPYCSRESCVAGFDIMPPPLLLERAAAAINAAERPVILAGWGAFAAAAEVLALAKKIRSPILTTYRAKGILPEDNEWVVGILGNVGSPFARTLATESDLLITLGVGFSKFTNVPLDRPMVQVDIDPIHLMKNNKTAGLFGNCSHVLPALIPLVRKRDDPGALENIAGMKREWDAVRDREADAKASPLRPPFIMKVLSDTLPEDAIISVDVGENQWWFGRNFRMKRHRFVMSGYLATMGFGLPGAIAAKIACPDKSVVCVTGDGGFSQAMGDFVTAVKYNLPMVVVVLNNHELGMIRVEQMMERYENFATDLLNPDFAAYADACGGVGIRVKSCGDLGPALLRALALNRPVVIDVETDAKRF